MTNKIGTVTGRITNLEPEMQELRIREPRQETNELLNLDFSNLELRILLREYELLKEQNEKLKTENQKLRDCQEAQQTKTENYKELIRKLREEKAELYKQFSYLEDSNAALLQIMELYGDEKDENYEALEKILEPLTCGYYRNYN